MEAGLTESVTPERAALGAATIAEAFRITAAERLDEVAIRTKQDEFTITWGELRERVDALAGDQHAAGTGRGKSGPLKLFCAVFEFGPAKSYSLRFIVHPTARRVGKGGRETSIDARHRLRRAHAEQLNILRDFAWAWRLSTPLPTLL